MITLKKEIAIKIKENRFFLKFSKVKRICLGYHYPERTTLAVFAAYFYGSVV